MLLYFIHYLQEVFSIFSSPIILYIIIAILAKNNYEVNIITKFNVILITKFNVILKNHVIRTISTKNFMESRTIQFLELRRDSVKITMGHYKLTCFFAVHAAAIQFPSHSICNLLSITLIIRLAND